jgi:outer membrane protein assembly factor BamA
MKKLLLLDADVVIDFHSLGLFEKICRAYDVYVTQEVYEEATYFKKGGSKNPINIADKVIVIKDVNLEGLEKVAKEAKEAWLVIDPGESTSIAYIKQTEEKMV